MKNFWLQHTKKLLQQIEQIDCRQEHLNRLGIPLPQYYEEIRKEAIAQLQEVE